MVRPTHPSRASRGKQADETVVSLAEHFLTGQISSALLAEGTDQEVADALIAVRGIGRWTVDMFLIFSLRRADVLPVGDLGVQKGLLRWALAAHGGLPAVKAREGKAAEARKLKYKKKSGGSSATVVVESQEVDTKVRTPSPPPVTGVPPTPMTPGPAPTKRAALHTGAPPTPQTPGSGGDQGKTADEVLEADGLPGHLPEEEDLVAPPAEGPWDPHMAAPLPEGLSVATMKSRLAGNKTKCVHWRSDGKGGRVVEVRGQERGGVTEQGEQGTADEQARGIPHPGGDGSAHGQLEAVSVFRCVLHVACG